jgi:hypothetical protein
MRKIIFTSILLLAMSSVMAQRFERAVGLRLGYSNAIFFDIQNKDLSTYRFMVSWRDNGRQFTAMKYFQYYKVDFLPSYLSLYYGYGIHAGYTSWDQYFRNEEHGYYWEEVSAPVVGLDGLIGVCYDLKRVPMSLTAEVKPFFDFWGKRIFNIGPFDLAISGIYRF